MIVFHVRDLVSPRRDINVWNSKHVCYIEGLIVLRS